MDAIGTKCVSCHLIGSSFLLFAGTVVIFVMLFTTALMSVNMVIVWQWHILLVALCCGVFISIEGIYMTSLLYKVLQGGWVPFVITAFFLSITTSWTYGRRKKNEYEAANLVDRQEFLQIVTMSSKVPGICIFCTDLMNGIPPIVRHYVRHTGSIREVTVFVTVRILPVTFVLPEERFLVDKLDHVGVYRCILQYGYMDKHNIDDDDFIVLVVASLKEIAENNDETLLLDSAFTNGTTFVFGRTILKMGTGRNRFKRFVINNLYRFLQKNFRSNMSSLKIAPGKTLQVGMHYEI
jgi:KUP system potassium uptake protein